MTEVKTLTYSNIQKYGEEKGILIPTLSEVAEELRERPESVMIEIKNLMTDQARMAIIDVTAGRSDWKLIASVKRFQQSFPRSSRKYWHSKAKETGTSVLRVRRHDIDLFKVSKTRIHLVWAKLTWALGY